MRIDEFPEELKIFVSEAMTLEPEEYLSYEINDIWHIAVGADEDGFNCELLYCPYGVDNIEKCAFVEKDKVNEIPTVIEYLNNCAIDKIGGM